MLTISRNNRSGSSSSTFFFGTAIIAHQSAASAARVQPIVNTSFPSCYNILVSSNPNSETTDKSTVENNFDN